MPLFPNLHYFHCIFDIKPLTRSVSTALRILSHDLSWTICSHLWIEDLNQLWKPVRANILASLLRRNMSLLSKFKPKRKKAEIWSPRWHFRQIKLLFQPLCCYKNNLYNGTVNQLKRKKLPKASEDFQGHEELKDGLPHRLRQPGALLLQSPTDPLHRHVHIISYLKDEVVWLCFSTFVKVSNNNNSIWLKKPCF